MGYATTPFSLAKADKRTQRGYNLLSGEALVIRARHVVRFKPSPVLTGALNGR